MDGNIVVVGAGTMGHGIAHVCAMSGMKTTLVDIDEKVLAKGRASIEKNLDKGVARGKVEPEAREEALRNLACSTSEDAYKEATLIIEAVPENMSLKKKLMARFDELSGPNTILASNTSSLSISDIAAATKRPDRVIGLHFFNPVHIMKLLEIVRGEKTSTDTLAFATTFAADLGKTSIVVNDAPGFATSRLGITLGNEAMRMVEQGVAGPADIDTAMTLGYKHPLGPLGLTDLVGLDVRLDITKALHEKLGTDTFRPPEILERLVKEGCLGKKSGAGFYLYEDGKSVGENPMLLS